VTAVTVGQRRDEPIAVSADPLWSVYRVEIEKLLSQLAIRLLLVVCVLGPFAFAAVLEVQSGTPSDAVFGVWVHSTAFAMSLVILSFAGSWGFPLIAGVVAGDIFASEDRHNTWKTILTRSCTRGEVFAGKLLAAATLAACFLFVTLASSVIAGVVFVGAHPLPGLSGQLIPTGRAFALTVLSWIVCVVPLLAYTSLAALFSIATRNGIMGVVGPVLVALVTTLLGLIGTGVWMHQLLIGSTFTAYFALFTAHPYFGPLLVTLAANVLWAVACVTASWLILRRRDFLAGSSSRGASWIAPLRVVAVTTAVIAALALLGSVGPVGVTAPRLDAAIATTFNNLTLLQQQIIGRQVPAGARLDVVPYCNRRSTRSVGPGDWTCNVAVFVPQPKKVPFQRSIVEYDVSVSSDGCFKAQSPPAFVGGPTMQDAAGGTVVNPLFTVYGCFNVL
jgi:ABC-2 type transport system permease protein